MNVKERIYTLTLLEKIKENPEYAKKIGLEIKDKQSKKGAEYNEKVCRC